MKIELFNHYENVRGVKLAPGIHDVDKPLGQYLIGAGEAALVESAGPPQPSQPEPATGEPEAEAEADYRDTLIAEYEAITGDTPAWNISVSTLESRLSELKADGNSPDANNGS